MRKIIVTIVIVLLALAVIGLQLYEILKEDTIESSSLVRTIVVLISCTTAMIKIHGPFSGSKAKQTYEEAYRSILRDAFRGEKEKKHRNRLLIAIGYFNKNQSKRAISQLQKLLPYCSCTEDYGAVYLFLALCYEDLKEFSAAIHAYTQLLEKDPQNVRAWSNLGLLYMTDDTEKAEACYQRAIAIDPRDPFPHLNLSTLCYRTGRYEEAIQHAEQALYRKKDMYQAANNLCLAYQILGNPEKSQKYYQIAIANGSNAYALTHMLDNIQKGQYTPPVEPVINENVKKALRELHADTNTLFAYMEPTDKPVRSRIGGDSIGIPPLDATGKPMRMLCAIYFSEVPSLPDFPDKGLLRIYLEESDDYGCDIEEPNDNQTRFRVLFTEDENAITDTYCYQALDVETFFDTFPINGSTSVRFRHVTSSMTFSDYRFGPLLDRYLSDYQEPPFAQQTKETRNFVWQSFCTAHPGIGAHPYFWQCDPRGEDDNYAHHTVTLFQLCSNDFENGSIAIGEEGVMNFFMRREDLMNRDFSHVLYYWDCD